MKAVLAATATARASRLLEGLRSAPEGIGEITRFARKAGVSAPKFYDHRSLALHTVEMKGDRYRAWARTGRHRQRLRMTMAQQAQQKYGPPGLVHDGPPETAFILARERLRRKDRSLYRRPLSCWLPSVFS